MSTAYNPKVHSNSSKSEVIIPKLKDPIALELNNAKDLLNTYTKWPLIPYSSSRTQPMSGLLDLLNSLRHGSSTLGACVESIKTFAFGGKIGVKYIKDLEFSIDAPEVSPELKRAFFDSIKEIDKETLTFRELSENLYESFKMNGNMIIELVLTESLGVKKTSIYQHATEHVNYWASKENKSDMAVISLQWDVTYLTLNPPKFIPVYPNYTEDKDGTLRTILHIKNGNFKYFGRPDWSACWKDAFSEYQHIDYRVKIAGNQFVAQVFMELEDGDSEIESALGSISDGTNDDNDSDTELIIEKIERNLVAKSDDPQTVIVTTRPKGTGNAFIHEFKPYTQEKYFKTVSDLNRQKIIENNQWSERLLGNATTGSFNSNDWLQELETKETSVLDHYRTIVGYILNLCFKEHNRFNGRLELLDLGIDYESKYKFASRTSPKERVEAFGSAARSGSVTPTLQDEMQIRSMLGLPEVDEFVLNAWKEDGGFRRPITLKGSVDSDTSNQNNV